MTEIEKLERKLAESKGKIDYLAKTAQHLQEALDSSGETNQALARRLYAVDEKLDIARRALESLDLESEDFSLPGLSQNEKWSVIRTIITESLKKL